MHVNAVNVPQVGSDHPIPAPQSRTQDASKRTIDSDKPSLSDAKAMSTQSSLAGFSFVTVLSVAAALAFRVSQGVYQPVKAYMSAVRWVNTALR
jgi:hypothetical protein